MLVDDWVSVLDEDEEFGDDIEWGEGSDEPVVVECSLESPESCESCQ